MARLATIAQWGSQSRRAMKVVDMPNTVSVVIPAHNEAAIIADALQRLIDTDPGGRLELVVAANGCTDDTAAVAAAVSPRVRVVEVAAASKTAALNAGDDAAVSFPRVYLDADVRVTAQALLQVADALSDPPYAGAPRLEVDAAGASLWVRWHCKIWELTDYRAANMVGSGVYVLSRAGRARFDRFPDVIADDWYVMRLFTTDERVSPADQVFTIRVPSTWAAFMRRQARIIAGNEEVTYLFPELPGAVAAGSVSALVRRVAGRPSLWLPAVPYLLSRVIAGGRARKVRGNWRAQAWNRDEASRTPAPEAQHPSSDPQPKEHRGMVASATEVTIDHLLLTRFNLPSIGPESLIRAEDGWLQDRVELFERFTVPSVDAQTAAGKFHWLVFLDKESPRWLIDRLAPLVERAVFTPVYGAQFTNEEVVEHARSLTGGKGDILITTNLDNDDGLAVDFIERLQRLAQVREPTALYLANGIILAGDRAFLRHDPHNAFVSVAEPWGGAKTVWRDWHTMLHKQMAVRTDGGRPAWLQVVHGRNVSNRIRGRLINPAAYRGEFAGQLDGLPVPSRRVLLYDGLVSMRVRKTQETARHAGKAVLLRTVGRAGLDRVKEWLQ